MRPTVVRLRPETGKVIGHRYIRSKNSKDISSEMLGKRFSYRAVKREVLESGVVGERQRREYTNNIAFLFRSR